MPYKIGDTVEVRGDRSRHGFAKGDKVRIDSDHGVDEISGERTYKVTRNRDGRKTSQYVTAKDLVKRRAK